MLKLIPPPRACPINNLHLPRAKANACRVKSIDRPLQFRVVRKEALPL
jgi:hypothetical protein